MSPPGEKLNSEKTDYRTAVAPDFARRYLDTYFTGIDADEKVICTFLAEEYAKLRGSPDMIDIGCGPCIQHVLSSVPYVKSIQLADYLEDNLDELRKWAQEQGGAFDWNHFTEFILQLETADSSSVEITARESALRGKITHIRQANVLNESVLGEDRQFGAVGFFYCAEAATRTKPEWRKAVSNVARLVEPGGRMFMASCRNTDFYTVEIPGLPEEKIPTANVDENDFKSLLPDIGFSLNDSRIEVVNVGMGADHGVEDIILLSLLKKGEPINTEVAAHSAHDIVNRTS
jgi:hypothetical protein